VILCDHIKSSSLTWCKCTFEPKKEIDMAKKNKKIWRSHHVQKRKQKTNVKKRKQSVTKPPYYNYTPKTKTI
jgi:hypothetical protein